MILRAPKDFFAHYTEDDCYREMLVERLGLSNWGLIDGGSAEPA